MANNEIPFFGTDEWKKYHENELEELSKNPPQPVNFTYTVEQLKNIYNNFTPVINNSSGPNYIEDYWWEMEPSIPGDVNKFINAIYEFYQLENKNDLANVEKIYTTIVTNSNDIQVPNEFWKTEQEIGKHLDYLRDMKAIDKYHKEQENKKIEQERLKAEQIQQEQQLKAQQISPVEKMNNFFNTINESKQQNSNQQQETYVTLEQLEPLLSESGYMCYGHGTGRKGNSDEVVDSIFNEGLRTKNNSLYYTTIGLSTPTPEIKAQLKEIGMQEPTIEDLKSQFNNWKHQDSKKIIIARIPTEYINKAGDRSDLDGEMFGAFYTQKAQPNGQETNYLDPKFIVGCFDVDKQAVRLNKNFERTLTPETIEQLKENYKKTVEKTNARRERQNLGITQEEINIAQQTQAQSVSYNTETYDNFDDNIDWNNISSEQAEIEQLKEQISEYDKRITTLLSSMQPYMRIPKVNQEMSKVIEKNNEINSSQIIDSLNDYKTVVEIKQSLLTYLEQADKFIKDNVGKQQDEDIEQQKDPASVLDDSDTWGWLNNENQSVVPQPAHVQVENNTPTSTDDLWKEFDQPQGGKNYTEEDFERIMADFKNPDPTVKPERRYNSDGTYTMEYIVHTATTPLGFNQTIYDQLMQENEIKRQQSEEQMTSGGRHM